MSSNNINPDDELPEKSGIGVVGYELAQAYDLATGMALYGIAGIILGVSNVLRAGVPDFNAVLTTTTPIEFLLTSTTELMLPAFSSILLVFGLVLTLTGIAVTIQYARAVGVKYYVRSLLPLPDAGEQDPIRQSDLITVSFVIATITGIPVLMMAAWTPTSIIGQFGITITTLIFALLAADLVLDRHAF